MPRLSPEERQSRLRLDERTMALVNIDPAPVTVSAHASANDACAGRNPITVGSTPAAPVHYRVTYDFDTLSGPGTRTHPTVVHIDLTANGDYPFKQPVCRVVSGTVPWTPHFHAVHPICIGEGWRGDGKTLAVDLVVHIAKLLNFDEPPPTPGYEGWNAQAIRWWINDQGCKPLDPSLRYPVIDPNIAPGAGGRRIVATSPPAGRIVAAATPARRVIAASPRTTRVAAAGPPVSRIRAAGQPAGSRIRPAGARP